MTRNSLRIIEAPRMTRNFLRMAMQRGLPSYLIFEDDEGVEIPCAVATKV